MKQAKKKDVENLLRSLGYDITTDTHQMQLCVVEELRVNCL